MKLLDIVKMACSLVTSIGTGKIISTLAKEAVENSKGFEKICTVISVSAISGYIADKVSDHIGEQIDDIGGKLQKKLVADTQEDDDQEEE